MATKLTVSIIFLLFTLSYAQYQHEFPQRDVVLKDDVADLPESDSKDSNIFLPSQKTEPETREIDPEIIISGDSKPDEAESAPLTFVSFRPVNRHFRQGPVLPFRHGRRCGGFRRRGMVKPWLMRFNGGEMPYGKDMIEEKEGSAAEHGEVREMPEKIERFDFGSEMDVVPLGRHHPHRHHHGFFEGEEEEKREKSEEEHGGVREMPEKIERIGFGSEMDIVPLGRHHPHRHHHHPDFFVREDEERREKHHERDDDQEEEEEHHHQHPHPHHHHHHDHHDDGFLWKIRKFLPHF